MAAHAGKVRFRRSQEASNPGPGRGSSPDEVLTAKEIAIETVSSAAPLSGAPFAALFDWDGVLVDSRRLHEKSWERLAAAEGRVLPAGHFLRGFGRKNEFIIPALLRWTEDVREIARLSLRKEEFYRELVRSEGIEPLPGVREFLALLAEARIPCIIGSSTHRLNIETALQALGLAPHFQALVTAEDVSEGKPHPEVFLKAAAAAGVEPSRCVVFEDAPVGLEAAKRGGMKAIGVTTTHPAEALGAADRVTGRLDALGLPDLLGLWTSA